ncbi:MAG TPA: thiamine pyrophosphate-dependent dehydrogenase E1 component subunit alpha, partial [Thermomicrobiales bacterium]|nr:thiamine pyrophosphate-dependent dehydrogenase E1 component subunit alpha [Thermomicrobiales bacterium]
RMWLLNRAGRAPFVISVQGHEAAQVGMGFALDPSKDWLFPYYRDLALVLHFGHTARDAMLSLLGRADEPNSGGRQMPGHYGSRKHHFYTGSSPVGTQIAQAPGFALAAKIRGEDTVVVTSIGEGGTSQGDFHEGLNWASVHKLGVIFFVQNNHYAISVPMDKEMAVKTVAERSAAYGMPGVRVDGADAVEVYLAAREAVARARRGEGPTLFEAVVNRMTPHSSDDDDRFYRSREEVQAYKERDPVAVTGRRLRELGALDDEQEAEILARVKAAVNDATDFAEQAALPDPSEAFKHVYADEGQTV